MKELEKKFSQQMFDYMFEQIEANMRELGIGDISVNKKMKTFIRHFYNILLKCEKYEKMSPNKKINLFESIFSNNGQFKSTKLDKLVIYFDNFFIFTSNLSFNHIIKGNINFIY